jgi:predicted MFS family arabinose efflux permease
VFWVIVLVLVMTGLGTPAVANLGPTWITTVVNVPVRDFGFVAATWGIGAFLASVTLARYASFERRGLVIAFGAIAFALSFLVFATGTVPGAVLGNFGLGASLAATNVSATALIQHLVPNEVRGRVMSILLANRGLAQLVTLPLAAVGGLISLRTLFPLLAVVVLALVLLIVVTQPSVRRARISREREPMPAARTASY